MRTLIPILVAVATLGLTLTSESATKELLNPKDGSLLLLVPGGSFTMGSDDANLPAEDRPAHPVKLKAFYISKYPITNSQYLKFVELTHHDSAGFWDDSQLLHNGSKKPVCKISWYDAQAYCRWAGLRLPSEAEWEKAARGTDGRDYPWGKDWEDRLVPKASPDRSVLFPIGTCPRGASPYGCLDMLGNAREWCSSAPRPYPYSATDGREQPLAPDTSFSEDWRSVRGGQGSPSELQITRRLKSHAGSFDFGLGFRVARDP